MTSRTLYRLVGANTHFKCENFQRIGAFKFRVAFNSIYKLSNEEKARGVITYSSGNHAQAVALVGRMLQIKTVLVMPNDATRSFRTKMLHTVKIHPPSPMERALPRWKGSPFRLC